jgi:hypothetical protein
VAACKSDVRFTPESRHHPLARTNFFFSGPASPKIREKYRSSARPLPDEEVCDLRHQREKATLKKLGVLAIELAIVTLFVAFLWWAADKNVAFSQDQMWLVD